MNIEQVQVMPDIKMHLFHSRKKFKKQLRKHGYDIQIHNAFAQTFSFNDEDGILVSFILLETDGTTEEIMSFLAHEAVHVAQAYFRDLSENYPSNEFEAYVVQYITFYLFEAHKKWVEKHS